jgi:hypothetical protein
MPRYFVFIIFIQLNLWIIYNFLLEVQKLLSVHVNVFRNHLLQSGKRIPIISEEYPASTFRKEVPNLKGHAECKYTNINFKVVHLTPYKIPYNILGIVYNLTYVHLLLLSETPL